MNRTSSKEFTNVSPSPPNGVSRNSSSGTSLMIGNGQLMYRRSPILQQSSSSNQPQSYDTLGSPSTVSYASEGISETINSFDDGNVDDLCQKFDQLQRQVEALTATQSTQDERYKRSRQENDALLSRVHVLEDQIRELELNSEARAKEDERRFKDTMAKQMKIHSQECEQHLHANFLLQQDVFKLRNEQLKNEALIRTIRSEKDALELELQEKNSELASLDEEIHKLKLLVKNLKEEETVKSNIINILNEELEDNQSRSQRENITDQSVASSSQNYNQSPKQRSTSSRRSSTTSGFGDELLSYGATNIKTMKDFDGLEASLSKLREENKRLRETNEELQAQLLNVQLEEGRSLIQEGNKSYSLADEMGDYDVPQVVKALEEQQDVNRRLKKYIDHILLKIVEKSPEILDKTTPNDAGGHRTEKLA